MPLYSTDTSSKVIKDKFQNEPQNPGPEEKICPQDNQTNSWCYLFVHYAKVETINEKLILKFKTFIHKSIAYKRGKSHVRKTERPTISGLIFIQGNSREIQNYLNQIAIDLYLVKDCSTKKTAIIPDRVMQPFMQLSQINPHHIRFMPHSFDYYSQNHTLIKITSGVLTGMEGYCIRIARDKCLVTTVGNMTVAIGGISKESFENVDEYIRQRQETQNGSQVLTYKDEFVSFQSDIAQCFFYPQNRLDLMVLAQSLEQWIMKSRYWMLTEELSNAAQVQLLILKGIGKYCEKIYYKLQPGELKEMDNLCQETHKIITAIAERYADTRPEQQQKLIADEQAICKRYPFLPISKL